MTSADLVEPRIERPPWTFLSNHAHVLVALHRDSELRQRDLAYLVGLTQGAIQRILDDLEEAGFLTRERVGRRNRYEINDTAALRHPLENAHTIGELLRALET